MTEQEMVRAVVAEMRAADLVAALQSALNGNPHWRIHAAVLLREINTGVLPPRYSEALREVDARKRAAEILNDVRADADH
jgi:hypothetical protein